MVSKLTKTLNNSKIQLGLILALAFLLRFVFINEIPPGIHWDEIQDVLSAQSLSKTGEPMPGMATGILGTPRGDVGKSVFGELGSYLPIPWFWIFNLSWPYLKIPYILTSIGIIVLIYLLAKKLINSQVAIISALLLAVNPWLIFVGRSAYESLFSYLFYFLALLMVISLRGWKILISIIPFILAFASYFGAKPPPLPLTLLSIFLVKFTQKKPSLRPVITLNIIIIIILFFYYLILSQSLAGLRIQELNRSGELSTIVNIKRTASINTPVNHIFENKIIEDIKLRAVSYFGGLSPNYLFIQGLPGDMDQISIPEHGPMYFIDLLFIAAAIMFLSKQKPKTLIILFGIVLAALTPNLFNTNYSSYNLRAGLMFPILVVLSASGIYFLSLKVNGKLRIFYVFAIFITYTILLANFSYQYFARLPIKNNEGWSLPQRVLSKYLVLMNSNFPKDTVTIIASDPRDITYQYLLYSGFYNTPENINLVNNNLAGNKYQFSNINVVKDCHALDINSGRTFVVDVHASCEATSKDNISSIKDSGTKYYLVNDKLCNKYPKSRYPLVKKISELDIENYSLEDFCKKWITNPNN